MKFRALFRKAVINGCWIFLVGEKVMRFFKVHLDIVFSQLAVSKLFDLMLKDCCREVLGEVGHYLRIGVS